MRHFARALVVLLALGAHGFVPSHAAPARRGTALRMSEEDPTKTPLCVSPRAARRASARPDSATPLSPPSAAG